MNQVYREIENHIPDLRRYALTLARNPVAADDLVQDCVTRALDKSELFQDGTDMRAWLFTIMHNLNATKWRVESRAGTQVDPDTVEASLASKPRQESHMLVRALRKALDILPDAQRDAVLMAGAEGMTYEEIAERENVPMGTVKSRVNRGRIALREALRGKISSRRPQSTIHSKMDPRKRHRYSAGRGQNFRGGYADAFAS